MELTWWCSATTAPWTWAWRAYPGVWLFTAAVAAAYLGFRRSRGDRAGVEGWTGTHLAWFLLGTLALWAALDWPIGALGAGYLASVHTVQYLLLALVAAPLLLLGIPADYWQRLDRDGAAFRFGRAAAHPLLGFVAYNGIVGLTHVPAVVDGLMASQLGSFAVDVLWLAAGLLLWWPVIAPDGVGRMRPLPRIGYLFGSTVLPTIPAMFLVFADYPVYGIYERAPRVGAFPAVEDQQLAGLLMKLAADPVIWVAMAVIFFRWSAAQEREQAEEPRETGAILQ